MTPPDPLIGALFDGRYKILKRLGTGGMATVYLAEDQELGRRVAIKILNAKHASDRQFVERFRREASSAAGLSHASIVQIYDRGKAEGTYYIAMEVIEGKSLKELILERGPSPIPVAVNYGRQILAALRFAHRNGVVHRDIKPHNVLVDEEGRVKVTDFGIARAGASEMTEVGSIIGTAQYLSPEQARGAPVDTRSDLYSVGVVLYELLTGTAPYNGETPVEIAMKHLSAVPEPPSAKRPEIPPELDAVVLRALAKNPEDRYQSADEMDADLSAISKGLDVSAQTSEAATTVLAGAGLSAPTMISKAPTRVTPSGPQPPAAATSPPSSYYDLQTPISRRPMWPWLLTLALIVVAGFAFWLVILRPITGKGTASVPFVQGNLKSLAIEKIKGQGLKVKEVDVTSDTFKEGEVARQKPAAGKHVPSGSTVRIWVSTGAGTVRVSSVIGMTGYTAISTLGDFHVVTKQEYDPAKEGTVYKQYPLGNTMARKGSTVTIWVSRGPQQVVVKDVRGWNYSQAYSQLVSAGFKVKETKVTSDQPSGTVIDENPPPQSSQPAGTTIVLTVSKGPNMIVVPDVTNYDVYSAKTTLQTDGFTYTVEKEPTNDPTMVGFVISQSPTGGIKAASGSNVTIYVGEASETTTTPTTPTTTTPTTTAETP
jgi:serine/threonine protein kinase/beta-lactam-binding protein with PASTA domain